MLVFIHQIFRKYSIWDYFPFLWCHYYYKDSLKMKPCHICEKIVRIQRSVECIQCKQCYCHFCIGKHFPQKGLTLLGKQEGSSLPALRVTECFSCLKECKCSKCKSLQNVVYMPISLSPACAPIPLSLVGEDQLVPQIGLFRGKKVNELPVYLQRVYLKKKVLYSKHETSCLSNDKNIPEQQNAEQLDEKILPIVQERERKGDESPLRNSNEQGEQIKGNEVAQNIQKDAMEDEEEQPQDYQSEFPSRRAEHLHNQAENSAINDADVQDQAQVQGQDPNHQNEEPRDDSMGEEVGQNEQQHAGEELEEPPEDRNNRSSIEEAAQ